MPAGRLARTSGTGKAVLLAVCLLSGVSVGVRWSELQSRPAHRGPEPGRQTEEPVLLPEAARWKAPADAVPAPGPAEPADNAASSVFELGAADWYRGVRECGSPAVDGYAHVKPECLAKSQTQRLSLLDMGRGEGWREQLNCTMEHNASWDGLAVRWGIGFKAERPEQCRDACRAHEVGTIPGPFERFMCNVWVWCGAETCFEPDAHKHSFGDCWLKWSETPENPEINMRGIMDEAFLQRHPPAKQGTSWVSGACLPRGLAMSNGTWGPRSRW